MDKFKFLISYGLKKRIARKAFVIANIVLFIVTILFINIPVLIDLFSSSHDEEIQYNIDFYNNIAEEDFPEKFSEKLNQGYEDVFILKVIEDDFDEEYFWEESLQDVAIVVDGTISQPEIIIYTDNEYLFSNLSGVLKLVIIEYQIDDYVEPSIIPVLPPDYESPEEIAITSSFMGILILPMFLLVIMVTQFLGVEIIEEKSTKAIETIISSVPAKTHFFSKIISNLLFVIIQAVLVIVYGIIAFLISKGLMLFSPSVEGGVQNSIFEFISEMFPNLPLIIVITTLFLIVGTFLYLIIAALFASMAVTQEDYQQFQAPLMLVLLGGFYTALFGSMFGGAVFKVLSFIPFISPMLAPIAFASGTISLIEALISLVILILTLIGLTYLFTPVYRVSILSYEQTKFFTRVKSYFKKAFQKPKNEE